MLASLPNIVNETFVNAYTHCKSTPAQDLTMRHVNSWEVSLHLPTLGYQSSVAGLFASVSKRLMNWPCRNFILQDPTENGTAHA